MAVWHALPNKSIVAQFPDENSEQSIVYEASFHLLHQAEQVQPITFSGSANIVFDKNWNLLCINPPLAYEQSPVVTTRHIHYLLYCYLASIIYPFHTFL
jgi:hypothetical protein